MQLPQLSLARLTSLAAFLLTSVSAQAAVVTVTGIANDSFLGYTQGQPYTFSFTVAPSVLNVSFSGFDASQSFWYEDVTADDQIFTSISGSGITGSFTRPVTAPTSPYSFINLFDQGPGNDFLWFAAGSNDSSPLGLTVNGITGLESIELQLLSAGVDFAFPGIPNQPSATILDAINNPNPTIGGFLNILGNNAELQSFAINSYSVQGGIPNVDVPFGVDSTIGLGLLGLAAGWKLRRRRSA